MLRSLAFLLCVPALLAQSPARRALLVVSVDGLDYRYLRDRERMGLRIPNMRKLLREGDAAAGVIGVMPTVTWPAHTTLITGVRPGEHGILANRRPREEGGEYYWSASLLKVPTLWLAAHRAGLTTAAITWPVTVDAAIDFNLPEYFLRRNGGSMDLAGIEQKATPGLVEKIAREYPSFTREWADDRVRTMAALYLLRHEHPDLLLVHLVDHDSEAHDCGPFTREAKAALESIDELLGRMLGVLPVNYVVALVSDHGFERVDRVFHIRALLAQQGQEARLQPRGGVLLAQDPAAAELVRGLARQAQYGIGREIPPDEVRRFAPDLRAAAVFEPAEHFWFGDGTKQVFSAAVEKGNHGYWPTRADYRSVFILWGQGIHAAQEPELSMLEIAPRLSRILGVSLR